MRLSHLTLFLSIAFMFGCKGDKGPVGPADEGGALGEDADSDLDADSDSDADADADADSDSDADSDADDTGEPDPIIDEDDDGVPADEDCDDEDATLGAVSDDADCDGFLTDSDCNDTDAALPATDTDCDGVATADDCDDTDPESTTLATDADCDGVLTADDCDDGDPESATVAEDGDCDGALTADDCDDGDPESAIVAEDGDCDGALTADDCDDGDPESATVAEDGDCDGALTADDCDDADPAVGICLVGLASADYIFNGSTTDDDPGPARAGNSVASAGDVDGDGLDDILVGAPEHGYGFYGHAYLILSASLGESTDMELSAADHVFMGDEGTLMGDHLVAFAGQSVASAGDVDGDGLDDILVGASSTFTAGVGSAGKAYLMLGSSLAADSGSMWLDSADYQFWGEDGIDRAGYSVASAGDVDGDGLDDIIVGAYLNDDGGLNAGKAYIILGASLGSTSGMNLGSADYSLVGERSGDEAGHSVSSAGDVDGDGLDDILVGTADTNKTYLILGASLGDGSSIDLSEADCIFLGEEESDKTGYAVSSAGDVDGDGLDDILIGSFGVGKAYVVLGSSLGDSSEIELSSADYRIDGGTFGWLYHYGRFVSSAGDLDGDGLGDIIIGSEANRAYVFLGSSLGDSSEIELSTADLKYEGEVYGDDAGYAAAGAGDVDGDGLDDVLVGAPQYGPFSRALGRAYLVLSSP